MGGKYIKIDTTCETCKYFDFIKTIEQKNSIQLISVGICKIGEHKVLDYEFCSRGIYDDNWMHRGGTE